MAKQQPTPTASQPTPGALPPACVVYSDPEYLAANAMLNEVRRRFGEVERKIEAEHTRMTCERGSNRHLAEARALVYGTAMPEAGAVPADLKQLQDERRMLREADLLAQKRVAEVEVAVSRRVIERIWPRYIELVRRIHAAAVPLVEVVEEERALADALNEGGLLFGRLQRVVWPSTSRVTLERFAAEAKENFGLELGA